MHMSDALISPAVGGVFWAGSAAALGYASRRLGRDEQGRAVPLMGVLGAFVFAAQMVNFAIPGTGSSGHLGGGLLLAALLGPHAAFVTMASILSVQALFFADGGLLALGCNIFNMAFTSCYLAYPLVFRPLAGRNPSPARLSLACVTAAVIGLQFGALGVVLQTTLSGISELPFTAFAALMLPIHLAIGLIEGLITTAVLGLVRKAQPGLMEPVSPGVTRPAGKVVAVLAAAALVTAGVLSWQASSDPDGLEWSIARLTGKKELEAPESAAHKAVGSVQEALAFMPDYALKTETKPEEPAKAETSLAGVTGSALTLLLAGGLGWALRRRR